MLTDGTENQKDPSQKTGDASTEKQGTSKAQAKTYTEDEVKQAVEKAKSDALAKAGRDAKSLELKEKSLTEREEAIKAREAEIEAQELEEARQDPAKMQTYQAKQTKKQQLADINAERAKLKKEREDLERDKVEHEAEITAARETQREVDIWELGEKYGLDPVMLKNLNLSLEQTEEIAKQLTKDKGEKAPTTDLKTDSLVTSGAGKPTLEQLRKMPMDDYAAHRRKEEPDKFPL
jgi:hypothetical protein